MNYNDEKKASMKKWAIFFSFSAFTAVIVMVGLHISDEIVNKSRMSAAIQTIGSATTAIASCQLSNLNVHSPDDAKNPKNAPCSESANYVAFDRNSTRDCIYNTDFVPTVSGSVIHDGAIQFGCDCSGTTIKTCKMVSQCDFATTGKCTENSNVN